MTLRMCWNPFVLIVKVGTCSIPFVIRGRKCFSGYRRNAKNMLYFTLSSSLLRSSTFLCGGYFELTNTSYSVIKNNEQKWLATPVY